MSFGKILDSSMDSMEETRFKKKHCDLIQSLTKKTHFSYEEIECLLIIYYKLQKDGEPNQPGVSKDQMKDVLHSGLDMIDDTLIDRIFFTIEKGPTPYISMEVWVNTLSLFLRGTLEEKINFCYSVYDVMGDGRIGRDSILQLLRTTIISQSSEDDAEESVKDMIEVITKKIDIDRDGKISFNDYRQTVLEQPSMLEALGTCLPSRPAINAFNTTFLTKFGKY